MIEIDWEVEQEILLRRTQQVIALEEIRHNKQQAEEYRCVAILQGNTAAIVACEQYLKNLEKEETRITG